jgi:hypothetical protein
MAVTAIVMVMVALLFPALERAKGIAKKIYCKNNLHEMIVICNLYKVDNKGALPYSSTWLTDFSFCSDYIQDFGIAMCPDTEDSVQSASDLFGNTSYHYMGSSYDWEKNFASTGDGTEYGFDPSNSEISSLLSSREQKVIYDKSDVAHYGFFNVAFLEDGHVDAQPASSFDNYWFFDEAGNIDSSGDRSRNCNRWRHRYRHGNTACNGSGNGYGDTDGDAGSEYENGNGNGSSNSVSDDSSDDSSSSSSGNGNGNSSSSDTTSDDSSESGHTNNGHGNNEDGVDCSNPGQGNGGPNGEEDASGDVDDEVSNGNNGNGNSNGNNGNGNN